MSKLTAKTRAAIPTKDFAGAGRSYPIENASHAKNAIGRATQQENKGKLTPAQANAIKAKARALLGKS